LETTEFILSARELNISERSKQLGRRLYTAQKGHTEVSVRACPVDLICLEDTSDEMDSVAVMAKVAPFMLEIVDRVKFILESTTYHEDDMMLSQLQACFQAIRWLEPYLPGELTSRFVCVQEMLYQSLPWAKLAL
jgi:hypothetical protein